MYCFVSGCKSSTYKHKHDEKKPVLPFYRFPTNPKLRQQWVNAICNLNKQESALQLPKQARICIRHFDDTSIEQWGFTQVRLKRNSVPSVFPNALDKKCLKRETTTEKDYMKNVELATDSWDTMHTAHKQRKVVYKSSLERETMTEDDCTKDVESATDSCNTVLTIHSVQQQRNKVVYESSLEKETTTEEDCTESVESPTYSCDTAQQKRNEKVYNSSNDAAIIDMDTVLATTPKTELRYPAQITKENVLQMSPRSLVKAVCILKDACDKKTQIVKRLQTQQRRQTKRITSLQMLLSDLSKRELLSRNASEMVEVKDKYNL